MSTLTLWSIFQTDIFPIKTCQLRETDDLTGNWNFISLFFCSLVVRAMLNSQLQFHPFKSLDSVFLYSFYLKFNSKRSRYMLFTMFYTVLNFLVWRRIEINSFLEHEKSPTLSEVLLQGMEEFRSKINKCFSDSMSLSKYFNFPDQTCYY